MTIAVDFDGTIVDVHVEGNEEWLLGQCAYSSIAD